MPRQFKKNKITDNENFQAVCKRGDYFGPYRDTRNEAEDDADAHVSKPGCGNHIVKIVQTTTLVTEFSKNS